MFSFVLANSPQTSGLAIFVIYMFSYVLDNLLHTSDLAKKIRGTDLAIIYTYFVSPEEATLIAHVFFAILLLLS